MKSLKGEMESVGCSLCGDVNGVPTEVMHWQDDSIQFSICEKCGLKYMSHRPSQKWYAEFYQKEFWQNSRRKVRKLFNSQAEIAEMVWEEEEQADSRGGKWMSVESLASGPDNHGEKIWNFVSSLMSLNKDSIVLDIGSAFGSITSLFKRKIGCKLFSVEPSDLGRIYIEKQGVAVMSRTIEGLKDVNALSGQIDLIILGYVLENTTDPLSNLKIIRPLLSKTGKIYIDTSNFYYNNAISPYHPFIFTPESLISLLGMAGYRVVRQETEPNPMDVEDARSFTKAIYIQTLAEPAAVSNKCTGPKYPMQEAQKRGLVLAERARERL